MTVKAPFQGNRGGNRIVSVVAVSSSASIASSNKSVRIVNTGASIAHVRIGPGAQTASNADTPIRAGTEIILSKGDGDNVIAYISSAGTTLHIQPGEGGVL